MPYIESESEDHEDVFINKVRSLKHIATDLTNTIKLQTKNIKELEPGFARSYYQLRGHIAHLHRIDPARFRVWLFYLLTSLFFTVVLFVLFFAL